MLAGLGWRLLEPIGYSKLDATLETGLSGNSVVGRRVRVLRRDLDQLLADAEEPSTRRGAHCD